MRELVKCPTCHEECHPEAISFGGRCPLCRVTTTITKVPSRKNLPVCTGVLDYFPDALLAVAALSKAGNDKHNPGEPLHWARAKSGDEADAMMRHLIQRGTIDEEDGIRHCVKVAWRALALCQKELEEANKLPLPRGAK
jgi:hypothetical protein